MLPHRTLTNFFQSELILKLYKITHHRYLRVYTLYMNPTGYINIYITYMYELHNTQSFAYSLKSYLGAKYSIIY
jgi:hypothetical protein